MPNRESQSTQGDIWLGIFFLGTALLIVIFSGSIQAIGFGNNFDPGPKAFPIGLSVLLAIGGGFEFFKRNNRLNENQASGKRGSTVLLLLTTFLIYVLILPWLGFLTSTLIMATLMMTLLGNRWYFSLLVSLILCGLIIILFVLTFKVPLPGGVWGMPF